MALAHPGNRHADGRVWFAVGIGWVSWLLAKADLSFIDNDKMVCQPEDQAMDEGWVWDG